MRPRNSITEPRRLLEARLGEFGFMSGEPDSRWKACIACSRPGAEIGGFNSSVEFPGGCLSGQPGTHTNRMHTEITYMSSVSLQHLQKQSVEANLHTLKAYKRFTVCLKLGSSLMLFITKLIVIISVVVLFLSMFSWLLLLTVILMLALDF